MRHIYDNDRGIRELMILCYERANASGWHDKEITFSDAAALMHSELFPKHMKSTVKIEV